MKRVRSSLIAVLFCISWRATFAADAAPADAIPADAKQTIDAVNAAWVPGLKAHDIDSACRGFAADALFIADDGTVTHGLVAFEALLTKRFDAGLEITGGKVVQLGARLVNGVIVEWGSSLLDTTDRNGAHHKGGGYYLAVWQKDATGAWKITRNIGLGHEHP
jgi:ketosteroid isomerase-like protein